ncbi:hypothetical protein BJ322DRAFT_1020196 [Thelephora terrestris]|uniref:Uncharacterized protein n=1 Tax=Thelephora terrestris TaxID=56493 RepID=A0A9P6L7X4_9AGAM|nr:hypothetical protein BJ322DRAFT_1020196 [Thelephora terrestris]
MSDSASASTLVDDDVPDMTTCDDNDSLAFPCAPTDPEQDLYPTPFEDTSTICSVDAFIGPRSRTDRLLPLTSDVLSPLSSPFPLSPSNHSQSFWDFPFPSLRTRKRSVSVSSIQSQGSCSSQPLFGFVSERKLSRLRRPPLLSSTSSTSSTSTTDSLQTKVGVAVDVKILVPAETNTAVPLIKTRSSLKSKNSPGKKKQCCVKFVETPIFYEEAHEYDACGVDEDLIKSIPSSKPKPTPSTDTQKGTTHMGLTKLKSLVKGSLKRRSGERDRREPPDLGRDRQATPAFRLEVDVELVDDSARPRISGPYPMSVAARRRRAALSEGKGTGSSGGNGFRSFWGRLSHPA